MNICPANLCLVEPTPITSLKKDYTGIASCSVFVQSFIFSKYSLIATAFNTPFNLSIGVAK